MDLKNLDSRSPADAGTVVELEDPFTGEVIRADDGSPWTITVRGEDSAKLRAVSRRLQDKRNERLRKGRDWFDAKTVESELVEKLVAATISWSGIMEDGQPIECNEINARKLYSDDRFPWIAEQLVKAMADRKRFFTSASSG